MHFYKTLYSSDKNRSPDLNDSALSDLSENIISLENDDKLLCEGKVTQAECLKALKRVQKREITRNRWITSRIL